MKEIDGNNRGKDTPQSVNSLQEWEERFQLHRLSTPTFEIENNKQEEKKCINISHTQEGLRRCWKCQQILDFSCFNKDRNRTTGLQSKCRRCSNQGVNEWRKVRPENPRPPKLRTKTSGNKGNSSSPQLPSTLPESQWGIYKGIGMNFRDRKCITTKQQAISKYEELRQKELLDEADKLLGLTPRKKRRDQQ